MKVIILAGGLGTRLREETEFKPKPMIQIDGKPILWHLMKNLSSYGVKHFIVATGYKNEYVSDYFSNYNSRNNDFTVSLSSGKVTSHRSKIIDDWNVTVAYTGIKTKTAERILKVKKFLEDDEFFMVVYGDGLSDININNLIDFHISHKKIATVSTFKPANRFGVLGINKDNLVSHLKEKPSLQDWVNIGYFIFQKEIFTFLKENTMLEKEPMTSLINSNQLMAFKHEGFWQPMDTYREYEILTNLWQTPEPPWKNW